MAELKNTYKEILRGVILAMEEGEAERMKTHVNTMLKLKGKKSVGVDDLLEAWSEGYLHSTFSHSDTKIIAQMSMRTRRTRSLEVGGGVSFGPVHIDVSTNESFEQDTATNITIETTLVRQLSSLKMDRLLEDLNHIRNLTLVSKPSDPGDAPVLPDIDTD